jgi:hypothetical protein
VSSTRWSSTPTNWTTDQQGRYPTGDAIDDAFDDAFDGVRAMAAAPRVTPPGQSALDELIAATALGRPAA